jgi:polysaccharide biosynthesis protein PslH
MTAGLPKVMRVEPAPRTFAIAIAYSRLPLPMTRADQMTVAHLISFLAARGHAVDFYALDNGEEISAEHRAWIDEVCREVQVFPHGPVRRVMGVVAGLLRGRPLQVGWFSNAAQTRAVRVGLQKVDIGYSYYIRSAETMRGFGRSRNRETGPVTFLAMQLSQALNTRRMAEHFRNLKEKLLYAVETRLVQNYEPRVWSDFTRTVLIGQQDVDEIASACRDRGLPEIDNVVFGPHGVDVDRFAPRTDIDEEPFTLVFNGVLRTYTNVHAIVWFAENVWPLVKAGEARAKLLIVGRDPRPEVIALGEMEGVTVTGEVPDPADYIARAAVCINPVQVGAGMQNKLIEFMAMRKAVVATTVANEGIRATPGDHLVIADDESTFADAVLALLADPERRDRLAAAARAYILESWTWEAHFLTLEAAMLAALGDSATVQNALSSSNGD